MPGTTCKNGAVETILTTDMATLRRSLLVGVLLLLFVRVDAGQSETTRTLESFLAARFAKTDPSWKLETFCPIGTDIVAARVLREYGAVFAAADTVTMPNSCMHRGEFDVVEFQKRLAKGTVEIGGVRIELQAAASAALQKALDEAVSKGMSITPYDGAIAGSRTYGDTLRLWNGRFFSALDYWARRGRLSEIDRAAVTGSPLHKRILMIMEWESQGIYFSTDRSRSIFSSTAPPGSSQHLSMLAFDVAEYSQPEVREIMNRNGWYQTIVGDPLHFTFLGVNETELPERGLRLEYRGTHRYWVPNLTTVTH